MDLMQVPQARDWILSQLRPTLSSHTEEEAAAVKTASVFQLGLEGCRVLLASEARLWWNLVRKRKTRELLPWSNKANSNMWLLRALLYSHGWDPGAGLTAQSEGLSWLPVLGCHKANFNFCLPPRRALVPSAIWAIRKDSEREGAGFLQRELLSSGGSCFFQCLLREKKKRSKDPSTHPVSSFRTRIHRAGFYNIFIYLKKTYSLGNLRRSYCYNCLVLFFWAGDRPRASWVPSEHSTTRAVPSPPFFLRCGDKLLLVHLLAKMKFISQQSPKSSSMK